MTDASRVSVKLEELTAERAKVTKEWTIAQNHIKSITDEGNAELRPLDMRLRQLKAIKMELKATTDVTEQEKAQVLRSLDAQIAPIQKDFDTKQASWKEKVAPYEKQAQESQKALHKLMVKIDMWTEIGSVFGEKASK